MAGYLRWLAPQIDQLQGTLPERQRALRDMLVQGAQHRRTPDIAASLIVGWETFLRFAEDAGASAAPMPPACSLGRAPP